MRSRLHTLAGATSNAAAFVLLLVALSTPGCEGDGAGARTVILIADSGNSRIVQMDDFDGAGWAAFAYPRVNTSVLSPTAVAADRQGRVYASSFGDDTISRMDNIGGAGFVTLGRRGTGAGEFHGPFGMAVDAQGRLYVADSGNDRIVRMDAADGSGWISLGRPGSGTREFREPIDVALDSLGRIYVADRGNRRIVRFDEIGGSGWTTHGQPDAIRRLGPGVFDLVGGIAVGGDGRIYVTDSNQNVVISLDEMTGAGYTNFGLVLGDSLFKQPTGVFVDGNSPLYVASQNNSRVARFQDMGGTGFRTFGSPGSGQGELNQPLDVVVARLPE
jgi:streptogramin lyase